MAQSTEQKAASKAARRERDRAWRERYRERDAAEKVANEAIEAEFGPEIERLGSAETALRQEADARLKEWDTRIAEIKRLRDQCYAEGRGHSEEAHRVWSEVWEQRRTAQAVAQRDLDRQFPDLVGAARWSAAAWSAQAKSA